MSNNEYLSSTSKSSALIHQDEYFCPKTTPTPHHIIGGKWSKSDRFEKIKQSTSKPRLMSQNNLLKKSGPKFGSPPKPKPPPASSKIGPGYYTNLDGQKPKIKGTGGYSRSTRRNRLDKIIAGGKATGPTIYSYSLKSADDYFHKPKMVMSWRKPDTSKKSQLLMPTPAPNAYGLNVLIAADKTLENVCNGGDKFSKANRFKKPEVADYPGPGKYPLIHTDYYTRGSKHHMQLFHNDACLSTRRVKMGTY